MLKVANSLLIVLLVVSLASAQSALREPSSKSTEEKAREEREKKGLALVDEIIRESESLRLPENRVRIDIALADSIWPRDAKRAVVLFKQAASSLGEINGDAAELADRDYITQLHQQLRQEILQVAGNHDPGVALDFLRATRPATPVAQPYWQPNYESQLEMRLATQIAQKDPKQALGIAEDSFKLGLGQDATNLLYNLASRDKNAAEAFLNDILDQLRSGPSSKSQAAPYIALTLLRTWIENNRELTDPKAPRTTAQLSLGNLDAETASELARIIINAVLAPSPGRDAANGPVFIEGEGPLFFSVSYPGQLLGMIQQLKPILPDVERLAPAQSSALSKKIAEFDKFSESQQGPWAAYQQLSQNGTAEEIAQAAKTAPPGISENLLQQAAWKAIGQGDEDGARKIIEKISDPRQRDEMGMNLDRRSFERAQSERRVAEARAMLSRFPLEERVLLLAQMASSIASENKPAALGLLGEAEALLGDRVMNYQQLRAQLQLASTYEQLDPGRSVGLIEKAINKLNELAVAALVLNGFDLHQYFRDGELVINGGNGLFEMARAASEQLAPISRVDFDHAKSLAEEFQRPELRITALLRIAQASLATDGR